MVSVVEVDRNSPVRTDTRARLEYQGLTGVAQIAFIGGEPGRRRWPPVPGNPADDLRRPPRLPDPSRPRAPSPGADDVLERVSRVVSDNEGSINRTV